MFVKVDNLELKKKIKLKKALLNAPHIRALNIFFADLPPADWKLELNRPDRVSVNHYQYPHHFHHQQPSLFVIFTSHISVFFQQSIETSSTNWITPKLRHYNWAKLNKEYCHCQFLLLSVKEKRRPFISPNVFFIFWQDYVPIFLPQANPFLSIPWFSPPLDLRVWFESMAVHHRWSSRLTSGSRSKKPQRRVRDAAAPLTRLLSGV